LHLSIDNKISYIEPLSPADISGLRKDLKMVYINDIDVRNMDIQNIAKLMRNNMTNLTIGVEDPSLNNTSNDDDDEANKPSPNNASNNNDEVENPSLNNKFKKDVNFDSDIQRKENDSVKNIEYIKVEKNKVYENLETDSVNLPSSSNQNINEKGLLLNYIIFYLHNSFNLLNIKYSRNFLNY
jgi:hypothetical protein